MATAAHGGELARARVDALAASGEPESCRELAVRAVRELASLADGTCGVFSVVELEWQTAFDGWTPFHALVVAQVGEQARCVHAFRTWDETEGGEVLLESAVGRCARDISPPWVFVGDLENALRALTSGARREGWFALFGSCELLDHPLVDGGVPYATRRLRVARRSFYPLGPCPLEPQAR
jgi:hypothetical protein